MLPELAVGPEELVQRDVGGCCQRQHRGKRLGERGELARPNTQGTPTLAASLAHSAAALPPKAGAPAP